MGYMERLGLWGAGNPAFSSFVEFMDAVGSRGVCALELVAMDMKAQGMYVARTLSYAGALSAHCHTHCQLAGFVDRCAIACKCQGQAARRTIERPAYLT